MEAGGGAGEVPVLQVTLVLLQLQQDQQVPRGKETIQCSKYVQVHVLFEINHIITHTPTHIHTHTHTHVLTEVPEAPAGPGDPKSPGAPYSN